VLGSDGPCKMEVRTDMLNDPYRPRSFWRFCLPNTDGLRSSQGWSIPGRQICQSLALLELCFRFASGWDMFLGLVGLLLLCDLRKLVVLGCDFWDLASFSLENFLSAPIHSPSLVA
jgi:hypothetical protein